MATREILLVYDRECPVCEAYCRLVRIRESLGTLHLINARDRGAIVDEISARGLDIDQGMVLKIDDVLYYGADAIHALALISTPSGLFNRFNHRVFRSKQLAGALYPLFRFLRNLLLKILRRTKINNLRIQGNERF